MFLFQRAAWKCALTLTIVLGAFTSAYAQNPATTIAVDAAQSNLAISPNIYGVCYYPSDTLTTTANLEGMNCPLVRWGGDESTSYNWQLNAYSPGNDWYFETFDCGGATPGLLIDNLMGVDNAASAQTMVTLPMIGYLANLGTNRSTLWSFSIAKYGPQTGNDSGGHPDAGNGVSTASGNPYITGNNPLDAMVTGTVSTQQSWVNHLVSTWGTAGSGSGAKYYIMDNEPMIWQGTHRDVHPVGATMSEIYNDVVSYANAAKTADPTALVAGPEEWGWTNYFESGYDSQTGTGTDRASHGGMDYYPWLLQQLQAYQTTNGTRLLDVCTVHAYPYLGEAFSTDESAAMQVNRNTETRYYWDPNYTDPSWVNAKTELIPLMHSWVNTYYPGTGIGITEYNWGDDFGLNGATCQADVLGIFGQQGLSLATRWTTPDPTSTVYQAFKIYRNYDGNKSTFGNTSVYCGVADPDNLSAFTAKRSSDGALTVMVVNKVSGTTPITVSLASFGTTGVAHVWQISTPTGGISQLSDVSIANNSISTTVPGQSITLFVVPSGSTMSAPTAPTGLAATVGSGTVTLTWNATGGATSYTVKRSTVTGGPYANAGTVSDPSATSYTDSGLTNGTTYFYVVAGINTAGTSPNSAELSAIPIVPPTFTSAATGNPNPVNQASNCTMTATVTCASGSLTNGNVQIFVKDANGNTAATQYWTGQNFTLNQQLQYQISFTASVVGAYTVSIGVYSATWQLWTWNNSAGTITCNSTTTFSTSNAGFNPTTVTSGNTTTVSFSLTETGVTGLTNGNVLIQINNSAGTTIGTNTWSGQTFGVNQTIPYSYNWVSGAADTYTLKIGVFDSAWQTLYYWNNGAATIVVTAGSGPPAAPTGLTATAGNTQVALSWTASSGATNYNVYRGTSAGGESSTAIATGITTTAYANTGLTNGTTYYYTVKALNAGGTSSASNEASATPQAPAPPAPTGLTATKGNAQVALSWTASSGATSYNVYRGTSAGGESATAVATGITATAYTNTGLTNGTTYYFTVKALNAGGTSPASNEASATPQVPAPAAPTGLTATPGNAQVALAWTASSGATSYNVYRGTSAGGESATAIATGITATAYTNTGLTNGTKYYFTVKALNAGGTSGTSNEASATPIAPPAAPTGLTATPGNAQVSLTWTASSGATSYNVYRGTSADGESATAVATGITSTAYTNTGLTNGTKYYFTVKALNVGGTSGASNEAGATPSSGSAPPAPTSLAGVPTDGQIALTWTASSGATSYSVYRGTTAGGESSTAIASGLTVTNYTNTGLTDGTTYFYTVKALNANGTSGASNEANGVPAEYNFESGVQSWTYYDAPITGISQSTTQAFGPTHSLAVTFNGAAGTGYADVDNPTTPAGKVITFHIWIPSGSQITAIQPYEMDANYSWTGTYLTISQLTTNAWNTVTVTVPTTAVTPLFQVGVQFVTGATWSGTCYLDSISW